MALFNSCLDLLTNLCYVCYLSVLIGLNIKRDALPSIELKYIVDTIVVTVRKAVRKCKKKKNNRIFTFS